MWKQKILFERHQVFEYPGLQNRLYAWSRQHNIVFAESNTVDGVTVSFGRPSELSVFLLTWPADRPQPRVL